MECALLRTWKELIPACRNDHEAAKISDVAGLFPNVRIVTLDMNGYFDEHNKTFVRQELVRLELSISSLDVQLQEKIGKVINVYNDMKQDQIVFGQDLQNEILAYGAS